MSVYGGWKTATIDVSVDDDLSNAVDLGASYDFLDIILPTLDSTTVSLQVCKTDDGTYQSLGDSITTATTTGGYSTTFKLGGWQHIKVKTSASQTADRSIEVRGWRF
jgi:hypothetical protein